MTTKPPSCPTVAASNLITTGPFAWSRNPIYVGNTVLVIAAGLLFGKLWLILLAPVAAYVTQKLAIEREEKHLAAKFGKEWQDYAARVRDDGCNEIIRTFGYSETIPPFRHPKPSLHFVIPAKAGIPAWNQVSLCRSWAPAFAGVTGERGFDITSSVKQKRSLAFAPKTVRPASHDANAVRMNQP